MRLHQIVTESHLDALLTTGFWGKQGAGCIIAARDTKRICLPLRSEDVLEPHTWGTWGGAIDNDEDPATAAIREVKEEAGYTGNVELHPLKMFSKGSFRYHNFLAIVDSEFDPDLNWETERFIWTDINDLPTPLHFGLQYVLDHDKMKIISLLTEKDS